jgi:hypothetical protein
MRMSGVRANALILSFVLSAPISCKKSASSTTSASASPVASGVPFAPALPDTRPAAVNPAIVREKLSSEAPPKKPPPSARAGALGVFYETVAAGNGAELPAGVDVLCEIKAWDASDRVVTDSTAQALPFALGPEALPAPLREELTRQRVGAHLRVWLPNEARGQRLRLPGWPDGSDIRVELKLLGTRERAPQRELGAATIPVPPRFDPPAASGPPDSAKKTPDGIRHLWLASGPEGRQPKPSDTVRLTLTAHSVEGLIVSTPVRDQPTTLAFASTPAGLKPILAKMVPGDTVRAWLPPAVAQQVVPQVSASAVVDVTLEGFQ